MTDAPTPTPEPGSLPLKGKMEAFCQVYVIYRNATRAAREAGYSEKTAGVIGHENLTKPDIKARIEYLQAQRWKDRHMGPDETLAVLANIARADLPFHITAQGDPFIDLSSATPEVLSAVASAEIHDYTDGRGDDAREVRKVKVTMHSKPAAVALLMKHHGLVTERVEVSLASDFADRMERGMRRAKGG